MVELDVPAMIHVSASCNPNFHATGAHYINADTTAFMQLLQGDLFARLPDAAARHPARRRRRALPLGPLPGARGHARAAAARRARDAATSSSTPASTTSPASTCSSDVIDVDNILFGSEMVGAVRGIDPETGHHFDDTKRYVDALDLPDDGQARRSSRQCAPRVPAARCTLGGVGPSGLTLPPPRRRLARTYRR